MRGQGSPRRGRGSPPAALFLVVTLAAAAACLLDPPATSLSRFALRWSLAGGATCADAGIERVELRSSLRADGGAETYLDALACADGAGRTRPLPPGTYDLELRALAADGSLRGAAPMRAGVELPAARTVDLAPFTLEIAP